MTVVDQVERDFDTILRRPKNFFKLPESEQWAIDSALGALDIWIDSDDMTPERRARFKEHFND